MFSIIIILIFIIIIIVFNIIIIIFVSFSSTYKASSEACNIGVIR